MIDRLFFCKFSNYLPMILVSRKADSNRLCIGKAAVGILARPLRQNRPKRPPAGRDGIYPVADRTGNHKGGLYMTNTAPKRVVREIPATKPDAVDKLRASAEQLRVVA